jgi:hypothetical protein
LYGPHNAHWIDAGFPDENKIMIYNNGLGRPQGNYSSVEIIEPPLQLDNSYSISSGQAYAPTASSWTYTAPTPTDFFSSNISGAQRLENGNTLVCEGAKGKFFEVDANDNIVWEYVNPVQLNGPISQGTTVGNNNVFRCTYYAPDFAGFAGRDLTPGLPLEVNPLTYTCDMVTGISTAEDNAVTLFPNPASTLLYLKGDNISAAVVYDLTGQVVLEKKFGEEETLLNIEHLAPGNYIVRMFQAEETSIFRFVKE